jgi:hypothetical protein
MQNINLAKNYLLKLNEPIIEINENEWYEVYKN